MRLFSLLMMIAALTSPSAHAGLVAPLGLDSAGVMPKGIRSLRIAGFTAEVENKYDGSGNIVPLANSFNKPVTWGELIASRSNERERGLLLAGIQAVGVSDGDIMGDAHGLVDARITSTIPVLAWGITDKLTLGVGVPIVYSKTTIDTGWEVSPAGQRAIDEFYNKGYGAKIDDYRALLMNVVQTKIEAYGYKPLTAEERTDIGDVNLGLKYLAYSKNKLAVAIAPKIVIPTGREADVDKVVDLAPGSGLWSAGVSAVTDYSATSKVTLTGSAGYSYQIEGEKSVRVPRSGNETISPDVDRHVIKKPGDSVSTSAAAKYKITDLISTGAGYTLAYKNADSYRGSAYSPERYSYLERDTWQNMQAGLISLSGSTVPLYKKGKFALPLDTTFSISRVFEGRNVSQITMAIFELAAYF